MAATDTQDPPLTEDELRARRDMRIAGGEPLPPEESIEDIEARGDTGEEDDGQMFVIEQGRKVTLGTLVGRNVPVTYEVKLTGKVLKGPGSLIAFSEPDVTLVVPSRGGKVEVDPVYDQDGSVKEVHVRQNIKARTFYDARTEAAQVALGGEPA